MQKIVTTTTTINTTVVPSIDGATKLVLHGWDDAQNAAKIVGNAAWAVIDGIVIPDPVDEICRVYVLPGKDFAAALRDLAGLGFDGPYTRL